jgi:hypothetical protein
MSGLWRPTSGRPPPLRSAGAGEGTDGRAASTVQTNAQIVADTIREELHGGQ